jgi:GNAT superfamily N-acetyltransferase
MDEEPARSLAAAVVAELSELYPQIVIDGPLMPKAGPDELGPPGGSFLVGYDADEPVCCGGVKALPDGTCEIKRMYVVPEARGRGLAKELLGALEDSARGLGYDVARLDTGPHQAHAERLYRAAGYVPIENFNANPVASFFGEKAL